MSLVPYLEVDLDALVANYRVVRDAALPAESAAVVKADAYGLGAGPVARSLFAAGCRRFFVATLAEGAELRAVLREARIYVLDGPVDDDPADFSRDDLIPVLNSIEQVAVWANSGPAALHIDTGMNRLGLSGAELRSVASADSEFPQFALDLVMTHLACADEPGHPLNVAQVDEFAALVRVLPPAPTSIGNSAGAFAAPATRGNVVRAGIALYGGNPFTDRASPVAPVATLRAPVIQVRTLERAEPVGYGASFVAAKGARIATVALGYADGYPRVLGNCGVAALGGARVPVVGRVSMDLICLDVSQLPADAVGAGDYAELYGQEIPLDDVASTAGTISYELLTRVGRRVERRYRGHSAATAPGESASD